MSSRHGWSLLAMVSGLLTTVGCIHCQSCGPQTVTTAHPPATAAPATAELSERQAALLCLETGEALELKGYRAEAIQQYEKARQHDSHGLLIARRLAVLYDLQGEPARAEVEYTRALQEQPNDATLLNDMGYFQYRHNHTESAERWLRKAVAADPGCRHAWINLGQVLARQGHVQESYEAFARVLRPAEAYSNLGVLLAKQGRTAEARHALQQALSLDPNLEQPKAFLSALPNTPGLLPPGLTHATPPSSPPPSGPSSPSRTFAPARSSIPASPFAPNRAAPPAPRPLPTMRPHPSTVTKAAPPSPAAPASPSPPVIATTPQQPRLVLVPAPAPIARTGFSTTEASDDLPIIISGPIGRAVAAQAAPQPAPTAPPPMAPALQPVLVLPRISAPPSPPKVPERPPQVVITDCEGAPDSTPP
jgi:Tfp pilus assembly protein PilF